MAGQQRTEALADDAAGNLLADTPPSGHPTYAHPETTSLFTLTLARPAPGPAAGRRAA